ncbi:MAG: hypothetical protein ACRDH2_17405, partial [Anaerolineales bacterium]
YLTLSPSGYMGRYTFPALPAYMILLVFGLLAWVPSRARTELAVALPVGMFFFGAATLATYLIPVYSPPRGLAKLPNGAKPLDATLGDLAVLKGYSVSATEARPGERVYVTLYWLPLGRSDMPFSVYIHLIDNDDILVAQRDTYPGLGRAPTTAWTPGQLFADRYLVMIPETAYAPTTARWEAGLWQADTGDRAYVLDEAGQPVASGVIFGELAIQSLPGLVPNPVDMNFGGELRLKGYSLPSRVLSPGQPFEFTVHWQPEAEAARGLRPRYFFVHVVAADGSIWANNAFAVSGEAQTVQPTLARDTPAGLYSLLFGVFDEDGQEQKRLKILADDGHEIDDQVRLTGVRVIAP